MQSVLICVNVVFACIASALQGYWIKENQSFGFLPVLMAYFAGICMGIVIHLH